MGQLEALVICNEHCHEEDDYFMNPACECAMVNISENATSKLFMTWIFGG